MLFGNSEKVLANYNAFKTGKEKLYDTEKSEIWK